MNEAGFLIKLLLSQVFDATNTTKERREIITSFAKEKGFKAGAGLPTLTYNRINASPNKKETLAFIFKILQQ